MDWGEQHRRRPGAGCAGSLATETERENGKSRGTVVRGAARLLEKRAARLLIFGKGKSASKLRYPHNLQPEATRHPAPYRQEASALAVMPNQVRERVDRENSAYSRRT